ncbi:ABC-2 type transport system permease protein [Parelusimicrobium proximum]
MAFYCIIFPLIIFFLVAAVFSSKIITKVPVTVIDNDKTYRSKEFIRNLSAAPQIDIVNYSPDYSHAMELLEKGKIFAVVVIDKDYEKDILKLRGGTIALYINNQYLMVGSTAGKAVYNVADALSSKYRERSLMSLGVPPYSFASFISPVSVSETLLYNPDMNYVHFIVLGLITAILQLFIAMSVVYTLLTEIKNCKAKEIRRILKQNPFVIVGAKTCVYTVIYMASVLIMLGSLWVFFDLPLKGSFWLIFAGGFAFTVMTSSTAVLIAGCTSNLRMALSAAAIYSAPAFAYFGVTFPVAAMPALGRIWAEMLPGTHFNRVLVNEAIRGTNTMGSIIDILIMLSVSFIFMFIGSKLYSRWTSDSAKWGHKL